MNNRRTFIGESKALFSWLVNCLLFWWFYVSSALWKIFCTKQAGFVVTSKGTRSAEVSEDVIILVIEEIPQKTEWATSYAVEIFEGKETFSRTYLFQRYTAFDELKDTHQETTTMNKS